MAATAPEVRECAGPDCDRTFPVETVRGGGWNKRFCSVACQCRAARLRRYAERRRYGLAGLRIDDDRLTELREMAVRELVSAVLSGADGAHAAKVAAVIVAADRRLTRRGADERGVSVRVA